MAILGKLISITITAIIVFFLYTTIKLSNSLAVIEEQLNTTEWEDAVAEIPLEDSIVFDTINN